MYTHGQFPVFSHRRAGVASFRMFTPQLIVQGSATRGQIQSAFGVTLVSIKRSTNLYRERSGLLRPEAAARRLQAPPGQTGPGPRLA